MPAPMATHMNVKPSDEAVDAWIWLVRSKQTVLERVERAFIAAGFPPMDWYDLLWELDRVPDGTRPQAAMQSSLLFAQYNLCRLLDRMEREGVVERQDNPSDGRSNLIVITPKGRNLRRQMWAVYAPTLEANIGQRLTRDEAVQLVGLLRKLVPKQT